MKFSVLLLIFISIHNINLAQQMHGIKDPENKYSKKCEKCISLINNTPREIAYDLYEEDGYVYFYTNNEEWFKLMFKSGKDGIAIEIINKDRYDCNKEKIHQNKLLRGKLVPPLYKKELYKNMIKKDGNIFIKLYKIPARYKDADIEFNLVIIKKGYYCYTKNSIFLQSYRWDLVDMGFFMDSLVYNNQIGETNNNEDRYITQLKKLIFTVPFEKNKSNYSQEDIQPLYDSLQLTNFNIKSISIRSYSSIEGETVRNLELQQLRSESIINAIQAFQNPSITNSISTSENWVEFLNDISGTPYDYLSKLSKNEIKEKLKNKKLSNELEPFLQKHRKAIIVLELQKKNKYKNLSEKELINAFNSSIIENNLEKAIEIQNSIFDKIGNYEINASSLNQLSIPHKSEFGTLLNKNAMCQYLYNETNIYETFLELQKLEKLLPKNEHIKYNLCAIKFKVWLLKAELIDPVEFKKQISALSKYDIHNRLIKRMLINYHIIMSETYMSAGDYANKDRSLRYIHSNYKYTTLTDADILSIAQYFSSYSKYDWATKLTSKRVKNINVNEDLLFYYLNLTLRDRKLVKKSAYRTIMLNAININRDRYCIIFNSKRKRGASFQLLENAYLRDTYCENCSE